MGRSRFILPCAYIGWCGRQFSEFRARNYFDKCLTCLNQSDQKSHVKGETSNDCWSLWGNQLELSNWASYSNIIRFSEHPVLHYNSHKSLADIWGAHGGLITFREGVFDEVDPCGPWLGTQRIQELTFLIPTTHCASPRQGTTDDQAEPLAQFKQRLV